MVVGEFKYWAFVSYSHLDNQSGNQWGNWLHNEIETFQVPQGLIGVHGNYGYDLPERMYPSFLDKAELAATTDLSADIRKALTQSRFMVILCSPHSAASSYVNQEVFEFKRLGRADRIFSIVIAGEPYAADPARECFPPALKHPLKNDGTLDITRRENLPLWINMRAGDKIPLAEGSASYTLWESERLRLFSGLLGIGFEQLFQREKERQLREARRPGTLDLEVKPVGAQIEIQQTGSIGSLPFNPSPRRTFAASTEPVSLSLIPGVYTIRVQAPGFTPEVREIGIERLHEKSLSIQLLHEQGTLNAQSSPLGSTIEVDGKGWGSPINGLQLDTGTHQLVARADNCFERKKLVEITKDAVTTASFWLEKGVQWKYASPSLQGGLAVLRGSGQTDTLIAHNELTRIIFLSTSDGEIKGQIATPDGNRRAFTQIDLAGSVGKVIVSGLDKGASGLELLAISSTVPPSVLWQWQGPANSHTQSSGIAVTAVPTISGVADLAVAGRDGHVYVLEGSTGKQRQDIIVSNGPLTEIQMAGWNSAGHTCLAIAMRTGHSDRGDTGGDNLTGCAINMADESFLWQTNFGSGQSVFIPQACFGRVPLMVLWSKETWQAIEAISGRVLSRGPLPGTVIGVPAIVNLERDGARCLLFQFADAAQPMLLIHPIDGNSNFLGSGLRLSSRIQPRGVGNTVLQTDGGQFLIVLDESRQERQEEALAAIDPADGRVVWRLAGRPRGVLVDDRDGKEPKDIFVTMAGQGLVCLDSSGNSKWNLGLNEDVQPWALLPSDDLGSPRGILIHRHAGLISLVNRPRLLWREDATAALQATPVVSATDDGKTIVVQIGPWGDDVHIRGFNGSDGSVCWSGREQFSPNRGPLISNIDDCNCVVAVGSSPPAPGNRFFIYRASDGKLMRSLPVTLNGIPWQGWLSSTPAVADFRGIGKQDIAVNSWEDSSIVVIDGATGEVVWRHPTNAPNMGGVAAYDLDGDGIPDVLSFSFDGYLYALRGKDGTLFWKSLIPGGGWSLPTVLNQDGAPFVAATSAMGQLHILDGRMGKTLWSPGIRGEMKVAGSPAVAQDNGHSVVLAPLGNAGVVAFDWEERREMWRSPDDFPVMASPAVTHFLNDSAQQVVIGTVTGDVFVLSLSDGKPLWHSKICEEVSPGELAIEGDPVVCDLDGDGFADILIASHDFHLYAISGKAIVEAMFAA